jgi:hypothetical protein
MAWPKIGFQLREDEGIEDINLKGPDPGKLHDALRDIIVKLIFQLQLACKPMIIRGHLVF